MKSKPTFLAELTVNTSFTVCPTHFSKATTHAIWVSYMYRKVYMLMKGVNQIFKMWNAALIIHLLVVIC